MNIGKAPKRRATLWIAAALFTAGASAQPQQIPTLEDIPQALSSPPRDSLDRRHMGLASTRDSLRTRIKTHFERCSLYYSNSSEARECPGATVQLDTEKEAYIVAVKSFNWDLQQAIGDEQNRLEKRVREMEQAISNDANAVKRFGFDRRAEDFDKWVRLSKEAQDKAVDKLLERLFETAADEMRSGILDQLTRANGADIDQMLLKLQAAGLGAVASADALRQYQATQDKQLLKSIAKQLSEDLRSIIKFDENYQKSEKFEAAWEALQFFSPPGVRQVLAAVETGAWVTYGVGMQAVAIAEVARLNKLTDKELKAVQNIHCLFETHTLERYNAKLKLAMLTYRDASELTKPVQSKACSK